MFVGLDARAASIVMRSVRNTVNTGRTVVCTIHQPNLNIFQVGGKKGRVRVWGGMGGRVPVWEEELRGREG